MDCWGRYRLDENRRRRLFARYQSGSGIFWRGSGHGDENQSKRDGCAPEEHAFYERGDDCGQGTVVGRNWQRCTLGVDRLERRGVGSIQGGSGASERQIHRAGAAIAEYFTQVECARRSTNFGFHLWRVDGSSLPVGLLIV